MTLNIFSRISWSFDYLIWKDVYSASLLIFNCFIFFFEFYEFLIVFEPLSDVLLAYIFSHCPFILFMICLLYTQDAKLLRCSKSSSNREVYNNKHICHKKKERSQINKLILHFEELEKEQTKFKVSRKGEKWKLE